MVKGIQKLERQADEHRSIVEDLNLRLQRKAEQCDGLNRKVTNWYVCHPNHHHAPLPSHPCPYNTSLLINGTVTTRTVPNVAVPTEHAC
jgi:hypothetical protein